MNHEKQEFLRMKIADFRFSVIGDISNPYLSDEDRGKLIKEKAARTYQIPGSQKTKITTATIRNWLSKYELGGKAALFPKPRTDRGRPRAFSDAQAQALTELLEARPELTAAAAQELLLQKGVLTKRIPSSSVSRFVRSNGLDRRSRRRTAEKRDSRRFSFENPLECVQSDAMHGIPVATSSGRKQKAILLAFIDDATRRIVYARFSTSEKSILFEDGIKHILKSKGRIAMLYTDNGSTFISKQTMRILEILKIRLVHSKPYKPQGRGKIERFFRTVRDQFLRPLGDVQLSLDELNTRFLRWLETEYHRTVHSSLGITPQDAWLAKDQHIKHVDPTADLDSVFLHHQKRKVYKDSIISLEGIAFEVPAILIGKKVDVYYDPHPPILRVHVRYGGQDYGEVRPVDVYANTKVRRNGDFRHELEPRGESQSENSTFLYAPVNNTKRKEATDETQGNPFIF